MEHSTKIEQLHCNLLQAANSASVSHWDTFNVVLNRGYLSYISSLETLLRNVLTLKITYPPYSFYEKICGLKSS